MERPELPPPVPGRSALPSVLAFEAALRERFQERRTAALASLDAARDEADTIRRRGEQALEAVVLEAEQEAVRTVEDEARDRASRARRSLNQWLEAAEQRLPDLVAQAVRRLAAPPGEDA